MRPPAYSSPEYWATDYVLSFVADLGVEIGCGRNADGTFHK